MRDGRASETAILPGVLRAAHQIFDDGPKILLDPVAVGLVEGWSEDEIRERQEQLQGPLMRHLRSIFVLRSRLVEDELRRATERGVTQYVLLGAGLDTFAFRQPGWARRLRIIEVDHPDSQAYKRACTDRACLQPPDNLEYCGIDFESTTLEAGLLTSSFDPDAATFFSWLGVTQYLTRSSIESTLRFVSKSPDPSSIGFTFALPESSLTGIDLEIAQLSAVSAGARGEPWLTRFEPPELKQWLREIGFTHIDHAMPKTCQQRFYRDREDGMLAPVIEQFVSAR